MDEKEKELENSSAEDIDNENISPAEADEIISNEAVTEELPLETENGETIGEMVEIPENAENGEVTAEEENGENEGEQAEIPPAPKKSLIKRASEFLSDMGIPDLALVRFIAVFFFISGVNLSSIMYGKGDDLQKNPISAWKEYIPTVNTFLTIVLMAALFIGLSLVYRAMPKKYKITDQLTAFAGILYFDILLLWRSGNFYLTLGTMIVSVVLIYYSFGKLKSQKLFNKIPWWIWGVLLFSAACVVVAFVSITTISTHRSFGTACHDFGLFVQMYHSLADNGTALTTCERDFAISHFKIHASYIFYALIPVFKMFPKPETLLISQAVLAMGGVIPMFLIAKRHNFKGFSLFFMGIAYVFCIGIVHPCYYEFHENAFLPTILMWLLWAVDRKNYIMFYIMSVITCIVKEDAPLYVVCIGLYIFFEDKGNIRRMNGLIMALFAGAYMLFITQWLTEHGDGQMMMGSRFGILMIESSGGLTEVVKNALLNPAYLFSLLIKEDTLKFFLQVMIPLMFIPLFTNKIRRFLLLVPFVVMNLVIGAGYGYAANVGFQYIFGPICLILYMCIINIDDMGQRGKQNIPIALGTAAFIMTFGTLSGKWGSYISYQNGRDYFDSLEIMLDNIPDDASIGTDTFLIPHVADHKQISIFDENDTDETGKIKNIALFDFVAVPVRNDRYEGQKEILLNNGYTLWAEIEGKCQIYQSAEYTPE